MMEIDIEAEKAAAIKVMKKIVGEWKTAVLVLSNDQPTK